MRVQKIVFSGNRKALQHFFHTACPKDLSWSRYGDKYYGPSMAERSFNASADFCRERGGRLASVATERDYIQAATASSEWQFEFFFAIVIVVIFFKKVSKGTVTSRPKDRTSL